MYLQNIKLSNFKNYLETDVSFSEKLNVFTGANGSGKTNLLDAIYYLSSGRSALNSIDAQNINHNEEFFNITGVFVKDEKKFKISCQLQKGQKKTLWQNNKKVDKFSEFIGRFPAVLITPDDNEVIKEGSEIRRSFFDNIFSQIDRKYLNYLIEYTRGLKSRNALLKHFHETRTFDADLLEPYNNILASTGTVIHQLRVNYLERFLPHFSKYFNLLTGNQESVSLNYKSILAHNDLLKELEKNLSEDRMLQRTTVGIHKDDFIFTIEGHPLKKFGSQGQQKSFLIAMKLAHYAIIKELTEIQAILLLDDIFDKLDENRISFLMKIVLEGDFGQVFITDARSNASLEFFSKLNCSKNVFIIKNNLPLVQP